MEQLQGQITYFSQFRLSYAQIQNAEKKKRLQTALWLAVFTLALLLGTLAVSELIKISGSGKPSCIR